MMEKKRKKTEVLMSSTEGGWKQALVGTTTWISDDEDACKHSRLVNVRPERGRQ